MIEVEVEEECEPGEEHGIFLEIDLKACRSQIAAEGVVDVDGDQEPNEDQEMKEEEENAEKVQEQIPDNPHVKAYGKQVVTKLQRIPTPVVLSPAPQSQSQIPFGAEINENEDAEMSE